ncbi:fimbrial protein [Salmonella enterica subsp. enterica]|uniref:Fimbrial protein n=1 Tax=Salmonella enterica I TaxID=59201 RepID=A0A3S4IKQ3_SALET|nr:fimbrial protein [Salmonella enterica subsp. enterica]
MRGVEQQGELRVVWGSGKESTCTVRYQLAETTAKAGLTPVTEQSTFVTCNDLFREKLMRVYMKRNRLSLPIAALAVMAASGSALAANSTNLDVNFTATILETTCNMKLVGGTGSDTVQELIIGNSSGEVRIDDVRAGTATADFKLSDC